MSSLVNLFQRTVATRAVAAPNPGGLFSIAVRFLIRDHFPRPSERKRIKVHGWAARMKTASGRRIIMNKILKGKHVYSH